MAVAATAGEEDVAHIPVQCDGVRMIRTPSSMCRGDDSSPSGGRGAAVGVRGAMRAGKASVRRRTARRQDVSILQLESGRPPKRRRQCYVDNDDRMWSAKLHYGTQLGRIFCYLFPHPQAWNELRVATDSYLGHCSYLLGC